MPRVWDGSLRPFTLKGVASLEGDRTFRWDTGTRKPGVLARWVSPGDWLAIQTNSSDQRARLMRRKDDDSVSTLKTSGTSLSLSAATWYNAKVVVDDDPNNAALQRLRFWVDTDDDGDYGDETVLLTGTQVDTKLARFARAPATVCARSAAVILTTPVMPEALPIQILGLRV